MKLAFAPKSGKKCCSWTDIITFYLSIETQLIKLKNLVIDDQVSEEKQKVSKVIGFYLSKFLDFSRVTIFNG